MTDHTFSRRQVLAGGLSGAAALSFARLRGSGPSAQETLEQAMRVRPASTDSIQHVVFLMQENRSFDHYFGKLGGVAGFDDTNNSAAFTQAWNTANGGSGAPSGEEPPNVLLPFQMNSRTSDGECTYDLSHAWPAEHACWNNGAMDSFVSTHTSPSYENQLGTNTMGYYQEHDIPFYWRLAKNFTICDNYFCSVLGPTHPNRLMAISANIDPAGVAGGPIIVTNSSLPPYQGTCTWKTMPDVLSGAGVSWKCYNPYGSNYQPGAGIFISKNMLLYFDQYANAHPSSHAYKKAFSYYGPNVDGGLTSTNPKIDDFTADVANGNLPQVSWIISPDSYDEHPPAPAQLGEWYSQQILNILTSNPDIWRKTVLFIMYDENDGFFDHVPPPTPPSGTQGEYLTVDPLPSSAGGIAGPIGLGVRVPMLVVSPYSIGGWVCSDVFDHTSQLEFIASVFNVAVPNISPWRQGTIGNLLSTLPTLSSPNYKIPRLPVISDNENREPIKGECSDSQILELNPNDGAYPVPLIQQMPHQSPNTLKRTPS
jgi:phospholipase C